MADNLDAVAKKNADHLRELVLSLQSMSVEGAIAKLAQMQSVGLQPPEVVWVSRGGRVALKNFGKGQPWGCTPEKWTIILKGNEEVELKGLIGDIKAMLADIKANPDKYPLDEEEEEEATAPKTGETANAEGPTAAKPADKPANAKK